MGKAIPIALGGLQFAKKGDARAYLKAMLKQYKPSQRVSERDEAVLRDALRHHPRAAEKIGAGIDHFVVRSAEFNTQCFWVTRVDGTTERFSYRSCV
jgi:hypothetical protein